VGRWCASGPKGREREAAAVAGRTDKASEARARVGSRAAEAVVARKSSCAAVVARHG
jgi:hypothetical protein